MCGYITVDSANTAPQNGVCKTQQMCISYIMSFWFHDCSMITVESNENSNVFYHFVNNVGFPMKQRILSTKPAF
jgi:hypothetical protein